MTALRKPAEWVPRARFEREREARKAAEALLEAKARELHEAQRAQQRFLRNVNHEFRTPMNGILGPAQLLQAGEYGHKVEDLAETIELSCRELLELFEAMVKAAETPESNPADLQLAERELVLIVDDNAVNRMVAKAAVEAIGLRTAQAENGAVALDIIAERTPATVLMDIQMPVMDGAETIKAIRQSREPWAALPIIVLTADAERHGPSTAAALGADGYMTKPVNIRDLQTKLQALIH